MPPLRVAGFLVGVGLVLAALVALSPPANAAGEELTIPEDFQEVVEGDSVPINVTFGVGNDNETVLVDCGEPCPQWSRLVTFDETKSNCGISDAAVSQEEGAQESRRYCLISFPFGFDQSNGPSAEETGQPAHPTEYTVRLELSEEIRETFTAHLSSASTCRQRDASQTGTGTIQRSDVVWLSSSGHARGTSVTLEIRDGGDVFFERTWTSQGKRIPKHYRWFVPLDLPISGGQREAQIIVDAAGSSERETVVIEPGVAEPVPVFQPGEGGQDDEYNRTQTVRVGAAYRFTAAPRDCDEMSWDRRLTVVTDDMVQGDPPNAQVRRHNDPPSAPAVEIVNSTETVFDPNRNLFLLNYKIPKDEQPTDPGSEDPVYDLRFPESELEDGNIIAEFNSTEYEVYPYDIVPEFEVLQDEVERLETAQLVMNLTYADDSPFTPNDTDGDLDVHFGLQGESPEFEFEANHREEGIWNVSHPLEFEYEPLGEYTWRVQERTDNHGDRTEENRVKQTITDLVTVAPARPVLDLTTLVDGEPVNDTQRTKRVQVRLDAEFKNGVPLTENNVDPSLGGVILNVNKRNQFNRIVDQDRLVMTHAGQPGTWIESFRVGRSPSVAPVGPWNIEIEARDDRTPANVNVTKFPFQVDAANVSVADAKSPPPLVNGSKVRYEFRLNYPDGSLVTERDVDESRGGNLDLTLERTSRRDQPAVVERRLDPRPVAGGQTWKVVLNASKIVPGNHFFNLTGQDIHGNPIPSQASNLFTVLFNGEFRNSTTAICPGTNATDPGGCDLERGETVYVVYPGASGDKGMVGEDPSIRIHRLDPESGRWILFRSDVWLSPERFFNLTGRDVGNNHVGRFVTDRSTPTGTYRLAILGRGNDDRGFAGFSQTFDVTRVPVNREVISGLPDSVKKTREVSARIENKAGDVIDTALADIGPVRVRNVEVDTTGAGTFVTWQPASSLPTGPATIHLEGRDLFGNPFEVTLGPMELKPVKIEVRQEGSITREAARGELFSFDVRMTYETGSAFESDDGVPNVLVRDTNGTRVDTGRAVERAAGWEIRWRPRADLPPGDYRVFVNGTDDAGNVVNPFSSPPIEVTPGTVTGNVVEDTPRSVRRGETVQARISFPTEILEGNATVTTGTETIGNPQTSIDGSTVGLSFSTDRTTELVDARFEFTGTDVVGNNLTAETNRFGLNPQRLNVEWVQQPPTEVPIDRKAEGAFVIEYPDGTLMRPGEGSPIVGLFIADQPLGPIQAEPLEGNPTVWKVSWDPPDDTRTDIPYHFSASARDRFSNEGPPVSSRGFFVQNPVVPDYVPAPGPGPWITLAAIAGLAVALRRQRWT